MAENNREHYAPRNGRSAEERALECYTRMLIRKIEAILSDRTTPWITENNLGWPKGLSGREYNGRNALMLYLHCEAEKYKIPVFMTIDQMRSLNYTGDTDNQKRITDEEGRPLPLVLVQKGMKSFPVFLSAYTVVHSGTGEKIRYDDFKQLPKGKQKEYKVSLKQQVYNMFNVAQTNMQEARPELYERLKAKNVALPPELSADGYCFPAMDEIIKHNEWLCPIRVKHRDAVAYSVIRDEIVLPEKEWSYDAESFYGDVLCMMIHSTGTKDRLERFAGVDSFYNSNDEKEKLISELGSALVMQKSGMSRTISKRTCNCLQIWLEALKKSPAFAGSILPDVNRATAMVNEKIEAVNCRLLESGSMGKMAERLPVTGVPDGSVSEFHMLDNESRDAVYNFLQGNLYNKNTGELLEISKPADRVVRVEMGYFDHALECVYDNLDSETLSKIVDCGAYFEGYLVDEYSSVLNFQFTKEFEQKRNDPNWLREQGIEGDVKWELKFVSTDGHNLVKAITENQCKLAILDHRCSVFCPFTEIGEKFSIEDDLGYMTELRRRLLSKDEKVDSLGRITFAGPPLQYDDTGNVRRDILIDGEAKAVFVLEPDSDIYDLNFVLEMKSSELLKPYSGYGNIMHDKENGIYYTMVSSLYDLFREKDRFYPPRVITDEMNMSLTDYLNLQGRKETVSVITTPEEKKVTNRINEGNVKEREEVYPGLYAFRTDDKLWGVYDGEGRVIVPPRWEYFQRKEGKEDIVFTSFVDADGEVLSHDFLSFQKSELADIADKVSRLSNVRIEERGERHEQWIAADVDGKPAISEKITDYEWLRYQGSVLSALELGVMHFATSLAHSQEEQMKTGMRM